MEKEIKQILLLETIEVADIRIEPDSSLAVRTYLVLYDNLDLKIKKEVLSTGASYTLPPIKSNHTKLIWQKAQQQVDNNLNDKRYNKPFEDDGAYAD